ncbi:MAG: hypothetical protein KGL18_15725 [Burkholderiales bacterium]|nr:hypothetical protein [Burkholderiales bacterium]MDE1926345.1 hypothetical protein [Burkholderiales bacterium]MDE2159221.1 hypothetical protein [Burkholderiales bacterium]MDE2504412.1 hypothetical protein [Burkholderiales bacterium]
MRAAPPVRLCCRGGRAWQAVQSLLPALAAGACVAWIGGWLDLDPAAAALLAALAALLALGLAWRANAPRAVALAWDGERWSVDAEVGELEVMIDLGSWLLLRLRLRAAVPARWVAVAAGDAGAAMHALRCAVHARAPTPRP